LANELVRLKVDVILAPNSLAARAVQQATTTVATVAPAMGDPVGDGLVDSLARPGRNITGLTFLLGAKTAAEARVSLREPSKFDQFGLGPLKSEAEPSQPLGLTLA
jgi:ABC-type uncharacterized transport system substrate-binding protein